MTYIYKSSTWKTKKKKKLFGILSKLHTSTDGAKEKLQFQIGSYLEPKYLWRTAKTQIGSLSSRFSSFTNTFLY